MKKIGGLEGEILYKYRKGRLVDPEDKTMLERLHNTGLIHIGLSLSHMQETAKITTLGYRGMEGYTLRYLKRDLKNGFSKFKQYFLSRFKKLYSLD